VILVAGLDERLLRAATAGDDADSGATLRIEALDLTAGKLDDRRVAVVGDQVGIGPRGSRANRPPPPGFDSTLQTGTFGTSAERERVAGLRSPP